MMTFRYALLKTNKQRHVNVELKKKTLIYYESSPNSIRVPINVKHYFNYFISYENNWLVFINTFILLNSL